MATRYGDVVGEESARGDRFILTAVLALVAGLLLSEWMNGSVIRTATDDRRIERTALSDGLK